MPQAKEAERSVLGILLNTPREPKDTILELIPTAEVFYDPAHYHIYNAILQMEQGKQPVDMVTVTIQLRKGGTLEEVGGAAYLMKLMGDVVSDANAEAYCRILLERYMKRRLIQIGGDTIAKGFNDDVDCFELIDETQGAVTGLVTGLAKSPYLTADELAEMALEDLQSLIENSGKLTGVPTGYPCLDRITNGWQPKNVIVLAARPSVGKTALALQLALNAAMHPEKPCGVGIFSLEMGGGELMKRLLSQMASVPLDAVNRGDFDSESAGRYRDAANDFSMLNICVDETAGLDIFSLRSKTRRMVQKNGVELIIIDYLQLMKGPSQSKGNREQEVAQISREIKLLAKELDIPIILLAQLNRGIESRTDTTPRLSDLRESGAIEQDADVVAFLSRPDYQKTEGEAQATPSDEVHIHVRKNRQGKLEDIVMYYVKQYQAWYDSAGYDRYQGKTVFTNNAPAFAEANSYPTMQAAFTRSQNPFADDDDQLPF